MIFFYLFIAITPLVRHPLWSHTTILGFTLNKWVGFICIAVAIFHLLCRREPVRFFHPTQGLFFLLFVVMMTNI